MDGCVFCGIAAGRVPSRIVHQDDTTLAIEDISPRAPFHVLVMPRRHVASLSDADAELAGRLVALGAKLAHDAGYRERGYRIVANVGPDGGQSVGHLHLHVLAGRPLSWPPG